MEAKNTMIISAFPGCGKTYLYEHQNELGFNGYRKYGKYKRLTFCDLESSQYEKREGWEMMYVDDIEKKVGIVDFILISQHENILAELQSRNMPFVVVAPANSGWLSEREKNLIKQQWIGRFILRDNKHVIDFESWLEVLKANYDKWTSPAHLDKYDPVVCYGLKQNEYLLDLINLLYCEKEERTQMKKKRIHYELCKRTL